MCSLTPGQPGESNFTAIIAVAASNHYQENRSRACKLTSVTSNWILWSMSRSFFPVITAKSGKFWGLKLRMSGSLSPVIGARSETHYSLLTHWPISCWVFSVGSHGWQSGGLVEGLGLSVLSYLLQCHEN